MTGLPNTDLLGIYPNDEWLSCRRKEKFVTAAKAAASAGRARKRTGHLNIYEYKCEFCGQWHIGHKPNGVKK